MTLNKELLDAVAKHKVIVIVDLPMTCNRNNELTKNSLVSDLKRRLQLADNLTFEQIVDFAVHTQERETFIALLNRSMSKPNITAPLYYKLFEAMGIRYIVEAHYSPLFRNEVTDTGKAQLYSFYSRDDDFSFDGLGQVIVSLFGDTEYCKDKLIISSNEFNGFIHNINSLSPSLLSVLKNTVLFIDFDPNADRFKSIYDLICQKNGKYPSEAFLISLSIPKQLAYGTSENLTIITSDPYEYLNALRSQLNSAINTVECETDVASVLPSVPYKYLHSFEQSDSTIFYGRDKEITELCLRVRGAKQIAMLTSLSGYGKTSLINAGLIPALKKSNDYDVFYIRAGRNPWQSLVKDIFKQDADKFDLGGIRVRDFFTKKYQLVVFDQFEECFVEATDEELKQIDIYMKEFLEAFPTFSLLISIRQDFFTYLTKFRFLCNAQINSTYNLPPLSKFNAKEAIQRPASYFNFSFEENLVDNIIKDLSTNEGTSESYIDPSQLQIVCYFLYQELKNRRQDIITAEIYNEMGKANGILDNYIDDSLKNNTDRRQSIGRDILKCFVSSRNTRIPKGQHEIYTEIATNYDSQTTVSEAEVKYMLDYLVKARLVRTRTIDDDKQVYELTHEYIIRKINEWMDTETIKFKEITELFRADFRKWSLELGTLMQENLYNEVWKYRNKIDFSDDEKSYILLCFIGYKNQNPEEMKYWININRNNQSCNSNLTYAINNFKGKKRILAGMILSVILPTKDTLNHICSILAPNINPHLSIVESELKQLGESIDNNFIKDINNSLHKARTSDMCVVPSASNIRLGLSSKARDTIMKKCGIENNLKLFFPDGERIVDFPTFRIDTYTVTNRLFAEYDENHHFSDEQADYPVVGINFEQARGYANWWGKDIPTEDEWEYAARGKDFLNFPWGDEWNYEEEKEKEESEKRCNTSLTGTDGARSSKEYPKGISPAGCYNMAGNVWEWTGSEVPNDNERLYVKGGSWSRMGVMPWTWYRYTSNKNSGQQNIGFRCVLRGNV